MTSFKDEVSARYARLVYTGLWFSPLKQSLDAFIAATQARVTGTITLSLYRGTIAVRARTSPYALYKKELATYGEKDRFNRRDAEGFINIYSLPYMRNK